MQGGATGILLAVEERKDPKSSKKVPSIRTRAGRLRPTSAPLSPASSKPAAAIRSWPVGSLIESGHAMPAEPAAAGALAVSGIPEARGAAVLFLLDPDSAVRHAVAGALGQPITACGPRDRFAAT